MFLFYLEMRYRYGRVPIDVNTDAFGGDGVDEGEEKEKSVMKKQHILKLIYGRL